MSPGQSFPVRRALVVIDPGTVAKHGWEIHNGTAEWEMVGVASSGRTIARVTLVGEFHRKTRPIPGAEQPELEE